jgi:hypothetical protein
MCVMNLQEKMFLEVAEWVASGLAKSEFLAGKSYSEPKFNYWVSKWKASQVNVVGASFRALGFSAGKQRAYFNGTSSQGRSGKHFWGR